MGTATLSRDYLDFAWYRKSEQAENMFYCLVHGCIRSMDLNLPEQLGSKKDSSSFWHFSQSGGSVGMCIMGTSRGARVLPSVRLSLAPSCGGWVWISRLPLRHVDSIDDPTGKLQEKQS